MVPTVRIVSDHPEHGGYIVINEADLTEDHVLFDDKPAEPGSTPVPVPSPVPVPTPALGDAETSAEKPKLTIKPKAEPDAD